MFLILGGIFFAFLIYKIYNAGQFWKQKGVVHSKYLPVFGSMHKLVLKQKNFMEIFQEIYNAHQEHSYIGVYQFMKPVLMIKDLQLIKKIAVKDFDHFTDHTDFINPESEPLFSKNLLNMKGQNWKDMRGTLSPAFTSSKMKNMFHFMNQCSQNMANHYKNYEETVSVNLKEVYGRFANDIIATTAFGIQVDSFADKNNEFFRMGKIFTTLSVLQTLNIFIFQTIPSSVIKALSLTVLSRQATNYFHRILREAIKERENSNILRPDVLHLLLEAKKGRLKHESDIDTGTGFATVEESEIGKQEVFLKKQWTEDDLIAQCLVFFFGGFDTISTAACFISYELAINPEVQEKLQREIDGVLESGMEISYETLLKMKYLDQVVSEGLRKWPPAIFNDRICTKDYTIEPITDKDVEMIVERGISLLIPVEAIHHDPKYFPEPEKFNPDRFNDENKDKLVPGSYLPFGIGPRNCIGSRFALLELKALLFNLLSQIEIVPVKETKIPYRNAPGKITPNPNDIIVGFKARKVTSL